MLTQSAPENPDGAGQSSGRTSSGVQRIIPVIRFTDAKLAADAAEFYAQAFNGHFLHTQRVPGTGEVASIHLRLSSTDVLFQVEPDAESITPAISLTVRCAEATVLHALWESLSADGVILMPLEEYPFAELYGWVQDAYGLTWQLVLVENTVEHEILPTFMFGGPNYGSAKQAITDWTETFDDAEFSSRTLKNDDTILFSQFRLEGQTFTAMDGTDDQDFTFTSGVGFLVNCQTQEEIDTLWDSFATDELYAEQAQRATNGWLTDDYGIHWRPVPANLRELLANPGVEARLAGMSRIDIAQLQD